MMYPSFLSRHWYRYQPAYLYKGSPCRFYACPVFFRESAYRLMSIVRYKEKFALRGEKPIRNQSTSLPLAGLLYLLLPKPISELPHIFGSSPLAFFIISKMAKLSLRFCSSLTVLMKSSTLATVCFVFISADFPHIRFQTFACENK
jgi:hypothetical protein